MSRMTKLLAGAAVAVALVGGTAGTASAAGDGDNAPHSTAPVAALINGDINVLNNLCALPWHWDGPLQILTDNAPYQACQDQGGVQTDAPAVDAN